MASLNVPINGSMRRALMKASLSLLLLTSITGLKADAQDPFSMDRALSQLRGGWEYRTYRDKWTLVFQCDHKMLLDREPADYSLIPGAIRVQDGNGSTDYLYKFEGNDLTLTLSDGSMRTYRKSGVGDAEQLVHGTYYSSTNSLLSRESLSFDADHSFAYDYPPTADSGQYSSTQDHGGPRESMSEIKGVYRVEGEMLILAFDDSTTSESQIRYRDADSSVADIVFQGRVFETDRPVASVPREQLPMASQPSPPTDIVPTYVPEVYYGTDPPPAYQISTPPPVVTGSSANAGTTPTKTDTKHRDFGSTRSKPGGR